MAANGSSRQNRRCLKVVSRVLCGALGEGGTSGLYVDAGVNLYLSGHDNKLQLALTSYTPEEGDGDAVIVRLQHQLTF